MDVITRLAALLIAILLAIDAFAGGRSETLRIERHSRLFHWHHGDDYRLHFSGGRVDSCKIGRPAFDALVDGDVVSVDSSRVFKSCDAIRRGDQVIAQSPLRKWLLVLHNGSEKLTLRFDCKPCEMHVVGKIKKQVMNEAMAVPMTFFRTRPAPQGAGH